MIQNEIDRIGEIYNDVVAIDKYVIMPNHIHMIILLHGDDGRPKVAPTISRMMQQFKGSVTKQICLTTHYEHFVWRALLWHVAQSLIIAFMGRSPLGEAALFIYFDKDFSYTSYRHLSTTGSFCLPH